MPSDSASGAPQAPGSGSGTIFGIPYLYAGLGVVGVVLVIYYLRRSSGGGASQALSGSPQVDTNTGLPVRGVAIDPNTGTPIDPATGLGYLSGLGSGGATNTLAGWVTAAENALKGAGYAPALIAQALYDYTNGNPLSTAEAGVINAALGKVGYPPDLLPFFGPIPNPHPVVTPVHPVTTPKGRGPSPADILRNEIRHRPRPAGQLRPVNPSDTFLESILKGKTRLPKGVKAPAGYTVGPNGYLRPVAKKKAA